jgi:triacylglycerol lipase
VGPIHLGEYFNGVAQILSRYHTKVYSVDMPTDASIGERAAVLKNFLETDLKGQTVNVIAHSLAGLDARYAISVLKCKQICSLTTIGTPHRGTPLADWAVSQMRRGGLWYWLFRLLGYDMAQRRFLPEITIEGMRVFNEKVPDVEGVKYFSIPTKAALGMATMSALLWLPAHWLESEQSVLAENGHDGMVPFDSQLWGKKLGIAILDHLGQMNHHEFRIDDAQPISKELYRRLYGALEGEGL